MVAIKVLESLQAEPRMSPDMVSKKLKTSAQYIRNIIRILADLNLVETPARGIYEITSLGEKVLDEVKKNGK